MKATVIYGPPGTGKTSSLKDICEVLARNDEDIYFFSHTKAAAKEATERIKSDKVKISTLHSIAYWLANVTRSQVVNYTKLKSFGDEIGFPINGGNPDTEEGISIGDELLSIYELAVNTMQEPEEVYYASHRPENIGVFEYFFKSYTSWKSNNGYIDFNDMLLRSLDSRKKFDPKIVIIDEAQDLSPLQWAVLDKVIRKADKVYMAGDDDQSIYVWGGADPKGMTNFEGKYDTKRKILSHSYRVPERIHHLSQNLIKNVKDRVPKQYEHNGSEGVIKRFGDIGNIKFDDRDTLILFRNHMIRKEIEETLVREAIPYIATSGMPGYFNNRYAKAIKAHKKLMGEGGTTKPELDNMIRCSKGKQRQLIEQRKFAEIDKNWERVFTVPWFMIDYFRRVDIDATPNIEISSIHGSKGREADRIILHTGMTQRTIESMEKDPDAETRVFYVAVTRTKQELDIIEGHRGFKL